MKVVRIARLLLGVSAKELAEAASLSARELRRIEAGTVRPSPSTLARLDVAFERVLHEREGRAA